jgi:hypothetical protein
MSRSHVSRALREQITAEARHRCGYCLTSSSITGTPMEVDHIIPESLGGLTVRENLWLACSMCNDHKGNRIAAPDPHTGEILRIFDLATFLSVFREQHGKGLPRYVEQELRRYLRCGLQSPGFLRVVCSACRREMLVAFSCRSLASAGRHARAAAPGGRARRRRTWSTRCCLLCR